jgi:hypothetical protein
MSATDTCTWVRFAYSERIRQQLGMSCVGRAPMPQEVL